jgi:ABC-type transport system involved in multi-copper enzyme maturation permease subunit
MGTWIIARLTFREASRRKIALTGFLLGLAFILLFSVGFYFINQQRLANMPFQSAIPMEEYYNTITLAGLYVVNFLIVVMAALVTADTLAGEISTGTIQSLATKPLCRSEIVLGKWLGYAILLALYVILMAGGILLSTSLQSGYSMPNMLAGMALMYLAALVVMTITIACSSRFSTLATGGLVIGLYGLAFVGSWVEQIGSLANSPAAVQVGIVSSLLMPSEAIWRRAAFEMTAPLSRMVSFGPFSSASVPSTAMIIYGGLYLLAALWMAVRQFGRRDL